MQSAKRAGGIMFLVVGLMCTNSLSWTQDKPPTTGSRNAVSVVPFVGCESNGQGGPVTPPAGRSKTVGIPTALAQRLAYYKAGEGVGVVAPLGWRCFGTYGPNGATLYVSPQPINGTELLSTGWKGFAGPAVQISLVNGDTSGRFTVGRIIARVFPTRKPFVEGVIAERIEPATSFPYGPYPADRLNYRSGEIVEFWTPPGSEGLGTASRLQKNDSPIRGVAILIGEAPDLVQLSVRLPSEMSDLTQAIIQHAEREATRLAN
jgi:hypothetical protein